MKPDKLKLRKEIAFLFEKGSGVNAGCIKFVYQYRNPEKNDSIKFGVSVPKRLIPKAVNRNLLKRRMREAFRNNLKSLPETEILNGLILMIVYRHNTVRDFSRIKKDILYGIKTLIKNRACS